MKEQEPSVPNSDPETLRNEERFRSYFEMGVVGIAVTSPEKGLFQYNDKLCEILGYSREELARKNWAELTHPEICRWMRRNFNECSRANLRDTKSRNASFAKMGRWFTFMLRASALEPPAVNRPHWWR